MGQTLALWAGRPLPEAESVFHNTISFGKGLPMNSSSSGSLPTLTDPVTTPASIKVRPVNIPTPQGLRPHLLVLLTGQDGRVQRIALDPAVAQSLVEELRQSLSQLGTPAT